MKSQNTLGPPSDSDFCVPWQTIKTEQETDLDNNQLECLWAPSKLYAKTGFDPLSKVARCSAGVTLRQSPTSTSSPNIRQYRLVLFLKIAVEMQQRTQIFQTGLPAGAVQWRIKDFPGGRQPRRGHQAIIWPISRKLHEN